MRYQDPNEDVESRVEDLLSRMTLPEKVAQMAQIERSVASENALTRLSIGSVLNGGGSVPMENSTPEDWADMVDGFQKHALNSRLSVPIIYGTDAVHGHNNVYGSTIFPHNIALGATRSGELVRRIGVATALEVRATGIQWAFAPCVAVCKDSRWGRCYESYGEDPKIVCNMASSIVSGLQGTQPEEHPIGYPFLHGRTNVIACAKHFAGDGGTHRGTNEGDTRCSFEELERVHILPYLNCLAQGVSTIMVSYSSWNRSKLHSDRFLITEILKEKLDFKGFVVSDWEGIDRLSNPHGSNYRYCISASINAGIDMIMIPFRYDQFIKDLIYLVESGEIPLTRINDAVERILRVKFIAGLFEHPFSDRSLLNYIGCKEHRHLAREAVRKSLVLLKNGKDRKDPILPLDRNSRRILVAGTHADDIGYQCGGWTIMWYGGKGNITKGTSILEAIKHTVGENCEVIYEERPSESTFTAGGEFSYAVVAVGEEPYAESLGDRSHLNDIPLGGADIINLVSKWVPTLAILISGRSLGLDSQLIHNVDGLVAAWLPGSEGGSGIADVIFGDYDFEGVLPMPWLKRGSQLGIDHLLHTPEFPVGFGLKFNKDST